MSLPDYTESPMWQSLHNAPMDDTTIRIQAHWFDNPDKVIIVEGSFRNDGFYLSEGGELVYEYTPFAWQGVSAEGDGNDIPQMLGYQVIDVTTGESQEYGERTVLSRQAALRTLKKVRANGSGDQYQMVAILEGEVNTYRTEPDIATFIP